MRVATVEIKGLTPYSPSRAFQSEKQDKESPADFDKRCWREHAHVAKGEAQQPRRCGLAIDAGEQDVDTLGQGLPQALSKPTPATDTLF